MRPRPPLRAAALLLALPLGLVVSAVRADPLRLLASDGRGVTLELSTPAFTVGPAGPDGRSLLTAPGLDGKTQPGRPVIPMASTLVALPPGANPVVGLVEGDAEEVREAVRLVLGDKPGFTQDAQLGMVPIAEPVDPIRDGPWPAASVELGKPFTLRGQRMVAVSVRPFRYDESSARLWTRRRLRVRIDFRGVAPARGVLTPAADRHWDPVLRGALINFEQGRTWRTAPTPARRRAPGGPAGSPGGPLFDRTTLDRTAGRGAAPARNLGVALFDESEPEVRIRIDTTGVYAIDYDALAAQGFPSGVPIEEVSLHRHEFAEDAIPAYVTIELPIEVDEAQPANNVFDAGDRIVVFVRDWASRSNASLPQRDWGDAEVVYATRVPRPGLRVGGRIGWSNGVGLPVLASYPWTQRWEKNLVHMPFPGASPAESLFDQFHWTDLVAYFERPETLMFEANHLDPTHSIPFTIAWQGARIGGVYYTWARVRNGALAYTTVADSVGWSGRSNLLVNVDLPGTAITEGRTNRIVMWARSASTPPHPINNAFAPIRLNWFEATYWRSYRAINDYLDCNSGDANAAFEVVATGFSDSTALRAYDVTNPDDPLRLTDVRREPDGAEFALRFQDDATGGRRRYIVFANPRPVDPGHITAVTRRALGEVGSGDYLLIVPDAWLAAAQPLAALRTSQGLDVVMSPVQAIFDEFNGGRRSAYAIQRYIRFALNNWGAKFVLLAGDGSEDPQDFLHEAGADFVPVHKIPGPVGVSPEQHEVVPSDGWYVWCLNGCAPSDDILPELFIGRIPANSEQELVDVVAKLVAYENFSPDQTWRNRQLLFSDDQYSAATTFGGGSSGVEYCFRSYEDKFRLLNEVIRGDIVGTAGLRRSEVEHFDMGVWLANEPNNGGAAPCRPDLAATQGRTRNVVTPELFTRLNEGRMWWNYQGHANELVLAHENFYRNVGGEDDKSRLTNIDKPFIFSAFSCHANAFARVSERRPGVGPPMGEEMVMLPRRGAIASYASVGYESIPSSPTSHINVTLARAMFVDPPHDDQLGAGDLGARVVLGEAIALAYLRYVPSVITGQSESGIALTYTLLGDPATRISIGPPQAIVTANGDTVVSDRPVSLAPPRDTLHLEADLVSNVEIRTITVIEGGPGSSRVIPDSTYTLNPAFPDTAAAGGGGRRYHLSYVTPVRAGVLRYTLRTVDRYGLQNDFNVVFPFFTQLRVSDNLLAENDAVTPAADLSVRITLPAPLADPVGQIVLEVDNALQPFTATASDATQRTWILRWTHPNYANGNHLVEVTALDTLRRDHRFRVTDRAAAQGHMLRDVMAFPNPFDDQLGSAFSYYLLADGPADVLLRVFTVSGRLVYERVERGLPPGYHQWPWNGRDADGDVLGNGVYFYRMVATTGDRSDSFDGRLVKLRKPRRGDVTTP